MIKKTQDENVKGPEKEPRPWSKEEMDEAAPYPIPEVDDDKGESASEDSSQEDAP